MCRAFSHTFALDEAATLPERYRGKLFAVAPLQGQVVLSDVLSDGSSERTQDVENVVTSRDRWFRPVDIKLGPDGALYIADWYDVQVAHTTTVDHPKSHEFGRIYRLTAQDAKPSSPIDYGKKTTAELIKLLEHPNKWHRQTALRLLGDRKDATAIEPLAALLHNATGQTALEALWRST